MKYNVRHVWFFRQNFRNRAITFMILEKRNIFKIPFRCELPSRFKSELFPLHYFIISVTQKKEKNSWLSPMLNKIILKPSLSLSLSLSHKHIYVRVCGIFFWKWLRRILFRPPCLTHSNIRYISRVKWSNPGKGVAPSPTPWCSSYWKGSFLVALR